MTGISFHIVVIFFALTGMVLLATGIILFVPSVRKKGRNTHNGEMPEQKKKLSILCLAGFIIAALYPLLPAFDYFGLWRLELALNKTWWEYDRTWLDIAEFFVPVVGIILSIAGLVTAGKKGRAGRKFGIAGIVLPNAYLAICVLIILGNIVALFVENGKKVRIQEQREVYSMGTVLTHVNTEYDVSLYSIPEGYDLNSLNISVSEAELKAYAGSKLQTIDIENDKSAKGKFQNSNFLIVRSDCFDEWLTDNHLNNLGFSNGYSTLYYDYSWEFAGYGTNVLDVYKDPSDKYIVITNCGDHKIIAEFFEGIGKAVPTETTTEETKEPEFYENFEPVVFLRDNINEDMSLSGIVDVFEKMCEMPMASSSLEYTTGTIYYSANGHTDVEYNEPELYYVFRLDRWIKTQDGEYYRICVVVLYEVNSTNRNYAADIVYEYEVDGDFFDYIRNSDAYKYASTEQIYRIDIFMTDL